MSRAGQEANWFIGWDVGGWNCDKNPKSRDAIVILNASLSIVGTPWRGNLRSEINAATTTQEWIAALFTLCGTELPSIPPQVCLAIDTPLGFSDAFTRLITRLDAAGPVRESCDNLYLFRQTERFLFMQGLSPLSAVKDMIGSQATKGMHVLARFASQVVDCGVWSDGRYITAIEAYPSACKGSTAIRQLRSHYLPLGHQDCEDALTCALLAYLFTRKRGSLAEPDSDVSRSEGWIWVPRDVLGVAV